MERDQQARTQEPAARLIEPVVKNAKPLDALLHFASDLKVRLCRSLIALLATSKAWLMTS
jgi:hypothetical protein